MKLTFKNNNLTLIFKKDTNLNQLLETLKIKKDDIIHFRNGIKVVDDLIKVNDEIIVLENQKLKQTIPIFKEIDVVYEDELLIIVNKEKTLLVHSDGKCQDTLLNRVKAYFVMQGLNLEPRVLHRLDKETTGLIIFLKHSKFQAYFDSLIYNKNIERHYLALVHGNYKVNQKIKLDFPIARNRHLAGTYRVCFQGKPSLSYGVCLENYPKLNLSLMSLKLKTGRTHQLRVHLSHNRHPIVGDLIYGLDDKAFRMCLQANKLIINSLFHHNLIVEIAIDKDIKECIRKYEK